MSVVEFKIYKSLMPHASRLSTFLYRDGRRVYYGGEFPPTREFAGRLLSEMLQERSAGNKVVLSFEVPRGEHVTFVEGSEMDGNATPFMLEWNAPFEANERQAFWDILIAASQLYYRTKAS
jgi:hypothetical protein